MLPKRYSSRITTTTCATSLRLIASFRSQSENAGGNSQGASSISKNVAPADFGAVPLYRKPPPAPVGVHLAVHQGGGTTSVTGTDPYLRRQPNQPTRLPESAVLVGATSASAVLTEEELRNPKLLSNRRLPIGEWLRKQFSSSSSSTSNLESSSSTSSSCPLLCYVQSLTLPCKQLGPREQQIIAHFEQSTIPEVCETTGQQASLESTRWSHNVVRKFTDDLALFDPAAFEARLESLKPEVMDFFGKNVETGHSEELESVFTILADNAKNIRNFQLRQLNALVTSTVHEEGGLVWSRFFDVVERNKQSFQLTQDGKRMSMWTSSREAATPVVSPAVCLLFLAVTSMDTRQSSPKPHALLSVLQGISPQDYISSSPSSSSSQSKSQLWSLVDQLLTREELFDFALRHIDQFLAPMDASVVSALRSQKCFQDLAKAVESVAAGSSSLVNTEAEKIIQEVLPAFQNSSAVHSLVQRVFHMNQAGTTSVNTNNNNSSNNNNNTTIRSFIISLLQRYVDETSAELQFSDKRTTNSLDLQPFFKALAPHWDKIYESFARELLANRDAAQSFGHSVATLNLSSGTAATRNVTNVLFEKENIKVALRRLSTIYFEQLELAESTVTVIKYQLLARADNVLDLVKLLINSNNSKATEIHALIKKRVEDKVKEPARPDWLYKAAIDQVVAENPNWLLPEVAVVEKSTDVVVSPDALKAHELLLRIYLRLTYVPHAANAVLKSRHRRRIGPIAKHKNEYNMEAEIGFVEVYNTNDFKQWDWQGWYQRMLDVFHRNISIRVRLDDIRRLDNEGKPFIDLQTERRLRVLAEDRVGAGMIKLDSDRFEDKSDNMDYGSGKIQQLLSEAKKAQLGKEYWPTVEVKVREPSGQSKMRYSVLDWERLEKKSSQMFEKYRVAKERAIYVSPTETWLTLGSSSASSKGSGAKVDDEGYTVDSLFSTLNSTTSAEGKSGDKQ